MISSHKTRSEIKTNLLWTKVKLKSQCKLRLRRVHIVYSTFMVVVLLLQLWTNKTDLCGLIPMHNVMLYDFQSVVCTFSSTDLFLASTQLILTRCRNTVVAVPERITSNRKSVTFHVYDQALNLDSR